MNILTLEIFRIKPQFFGKKCVDIFQIKDAISDFSRSTERKILFDSIFGRANRISLLFLMIQYSIHDGETEVKCIPADGAKNKFRKMEKCS